MKKHYLVISLIILALTLVLSGCGAKQGEPSKVESQSEAKNVQLGIIQIVEHPSLDASRQGFLDALKAKGYVEGENLTVNYQNAQGDMVTLNTIAQNLASADGDLILAIATPSAQAAANATKGKTTPVLFTAVTDPVAAGLVQSMDKPGMNLTGTTDMAPIAEQIKLFQEINPAVQKIGVLYNTSEVNSVVQIDLAKAAAAELGLTIVEATATNSSEVDQAAKSLVGKVDAIYVPGDNTVVSALEAVIKVAEKNKLLVIATEGDSVQRGCVATIGLDYYKLGYQTGEMAAQILAGSAKPQEMPVESQKETEIIINAKAAEAIGVTIPQSILDRAKVLN